jgi:hypothetical protein
MLSGTLDTFSVQDIFRLIESTGQSGRLTVGGAAKASFVFDAGRLHFADRPEGPGLAQRLTSAGAILDGAWGRATASEAAVWDSLVEEGAALDVLAAMLREELEDVTEPLIGVSDGTFEFLPLGSSSYGSIGYSVDEVLGGASERRDRWELLADQVKAGSAVPTLTPQLPTDADEVTLARTDWSVVARCDGNRSVPDIASALGRTHLVAAEAVARLIEAGVVKVTADADAKVEAKVEAKVGAKPEPKVEAKPEPKPESKVPESKVEAKDEANEEAKADNEPKAGAKVEATISKEETNDSSKDDSSNAFVATLDGAPEEIEPVLEDEGELVGAGAPVKPAERHQAMGMISALSRG